jgi:hypothetical protein
MILRSAMHVDFLVMLALFGTLWLLDAPAWSHVLLFAIWTRPSRFESLSVHGDLIGHVLQAARRREVE